MADRQTFAGILDRFADSVPREFVAVNMKPRDVVIVSYKLCDDIDFAPYRPVLADR